MASSAIPSLSVIVPNYNHAKYLDQSLPSILNQTFQPLEVIVLDDASTDNSIEVIQRIAAQNPLVRLVRNEKNLGVMPNLNKGLELARGDYVFIGSADDLVLPGIFEASLKLLVQHPQAGASCTICEWRYEGTDLRWYMGVGMADGPAFLTPEKLVEVGRRGRLQMSSSSVVFRREALNDVGRFIPRLRWHADWFAVTTCAFRYGICYVPEMFSVVNILPKSFYTAGRKGPEHRKVLEGLLELLNTPAYADVRPLVRDSGALSLFGWPMLRLVSRRREFRPFRNRIMVYQTVWRIAELVGKKLLPRWLARWILKTFYGR